MNSLPDELRSVVLDKLGLPGEMSPTYENLQRIYLSWCRKTGSDTIGLALKASGAGEFYGFPAENYFRRWVEYGISDQCFATSEALFAILAGFGYSVRRVFGSTGSRSTHGSITVLLDDRVYLVDATFLSEDPLLLSQQGRTSAGSGPLRVWGDLDGVIRWQMPQGRFRAQFRIEQLDCPFEIFQENDAVISPDCMHPLHRLFRNRIFVRRNNAEGVLTYDNGAIVRKTENDIHISRIDRDLAKSMLIDVFGISESAVGMIPERYFPEDAAVSTA